MTAEHSDHGPRGARYDLMVDWDKRLAREIPFFERLFAAADVRSIIDVGCGTGRHDIEFAKRGFVVTGVDPSEEMIAQARSNAEAAGVGVEFAEAGFGGLGPLGLGPADALICTGNALPHVDGLAGLDATLADFAYVMRSGAVLVLHFLNHERLVSHNMRVLGPVVRDSPEGTTLFVRLLAYDPSEHPERLTIEFLSAFREHGDPAEAAGPMEWEAESRATDHTVITYSTLRGALTLAGFEEIEAWGDHTGKAFEPDRDESVIVTAVRR